MLNRRFLLASLLISLFSFGFLVSCDSVSWAEENSEYINSITSEEFQSEKEQKLADYIPISFHFWNCKPFIFLPIELKSSFSFWIFPLLTVFSLLCIIIPALRDLRGSPSQENLYEKTLYCNRAFDSFNTFICTKSGWQNFIYCHRWQGLFTPRD